jgi:hypothetical protein
MRNPENVAPSARQVSVSAQPAIPTLTMLNFSPKTGLPAVNAARRDDRDRRDRRSWAARSGRNGFRLLSDTRSRSLSQPTFTVDRRVAC